MTVMPLDIGKERPQRGPSGEIPPVLPQPKLPKPMLHRWAVALGTIVVAGLILFGPPFRSGDLTAGIARSNGRIEAERIDIATKLPGRIKDVLVREGDMVAAGQVLARMDMAEHEAQLREAEAAILQAERQLEQARALVEQRQTELVLAGQELDRSLALVGKGYTAREKVDQRRATRDTAAAAVKSAASQVGLARATIDAAAARADSLKVTIADGVLTAPRAGRIQYRLAQSGEVLASGGKVVTLLDIADVYMTIFLPTRDAGRLQIGSEARIVFDAAPQYVIPAVVSFVATDAQFTPKYVETRSEREKLMFRVKIQIPPDILQRYASVVKTGVPGIGYVRLDREAAWPETLMMRLPE